jgi:CRISPR-associated protein Csd1
MILRRLYDLALREDLLADPAFETQPVPFVIEIGEGGQLRGEGVNERRGEIDIVPKKKGGETRTKPDSGKPLVVPRPHGNTASQGFARFFVDTVARVVPISYDLGNAGERDRSEELAKRDRSRATFWSQIDLAANGTDDPALRAVQAFGRRLTDDPGLAAKIEKALESRKAKATDRCTFSFAPDMGTTIVEREAVKQWYRGFYRQYTGGKQESGPTGLCQVTGESGPIPTTHPIKVSIPGGMSVGVALVSYDKAAFESYGMQGTANASIGYEAADGYGVALRALIQNSLPRTQRTSLRVGESLFLFWTRQPEPTDFLGLFDAPTPETVERLIRAPASGDAGQASSDVNEFYCLVLSGNAARAVVRGYLEEKLPQVRENVGAWFRDLMIASTNRDDHGHPIATFPLRALASSLTTGRAGKEPDWQRIGGLIPRLMSAALQREPLPDSILGACLQRLRAEASTGFRPARMALIKLCLIRKEIPVTERLNPAESNPAYICGELLAVFDEIQRAALGKVNATVVDRYYGGFSAAPLTALGRLFENAQNHLRSLRSTNSRRAAALEKRLALTAHKLNDVPNGQLTLADQARFALGYYHAKADRIERWAKAQQERGEAEARKRVGQATTPPIDTQS